MAGRTKTTSTSPRGVAETAESGADLGVTVVVRPLEPEDWPAVAEIYTAGIATGNATFETEVPSWEQWDAGHLAEHRLVAVANGAVAGWIALTAYSDRCCYGGVADLSVYVAPEARGQGIGRLLVECAIASSARSGIWTLQAGVMAENAASLALHERCGFRVVGVRERLGQLHGEWRDVVLLERRAEI